MDFLVSVIIPVYNAEKYVQKAVRSALDQTYGNIEVIVVNDGSTDNSLGIIKAFDDPRVRILDQQNRGGSAARNAGIKQAKGEYIKFLDADDELLPGAIDNQIKTAKDLAENEIVFGDFNFMNEAGKITSSNVFSDSEALKTDPASFFLYNWKILISCPLHKKKLLEKVGGFDEKLPFGQESDLHLRLAVSDIVFMYKEGAVFNYRSHSDKNRISVNRVSNPKSLDDTKYSLEKKAKLIKAKYKSLNKRQRAYFARGYFGYARKLFINKQNKEGRAFLSNSRKYTTCKLPPFKRSCLYGLIYLVLGNLTGFSTLESFIAKLSGKKQNKATDLDILFKQ